MIVLGGEASGRGLGLKGGVSAPIKETSESSLARLPCVDTRGSL